MTLPKTANDPSCAPRVGLEPYRLLFPAGWVLGVVGVLLWPLFFYELIAFYPSVAHARIMVQGFAACFVLGFLGTALPHMLEAPALKTSACIFLAVGLMTASVFHAILWTAAGDALFAVTLSFFGTQVVSRWRGRACLPPPGLVAVLTGLAGAALSSLILVLDSMHPLPHGAPFLARLFLYQGFLLLPVMGIGATLLPAFTGYPRTQTLPDQRAPSPEWTRRAWIWTAFSLTVVLSFLLEAFVSLRAGYVLRTTVLVLYCFLYLPVWRRQHVAGTAAWLNRLAFIALLTGYLAAAIWTGHYLAWLHIVFISGLGMLIVAVATRVIWAHGGNLPRCLEGHPALWWAFALITLGMFTRVTADWMPAIRLSHYAYAAMSWIIGAALWAWALRKR